MVKKATNISRFLLVAGMLFSLVIGYGQSKRIDWNGAVGGESNDQILDVIETANGYLVAVGETNINSKGEKDGLILITDFFTGKVLTKKRMGGSKEDVLSSVTQHWDGTLILAGHTASKGYGEKDAWLVNMDMKGNILWEQTYGTPQSDNFKSVVITKQGQIAAVGELGSKKGQAWLMLLNKDVIISEFKLGDGAIGTVEDMVISNSGDLVLTGTTKKGNGQKAGDAWLMKTNIQGEKEWIKYYGGNSWEEALALTTTSNNGYAIAGLTKSKGAGDMDMWLVKTTKDGDLEWDQTYGGKDADIANGIVQTYNSGYALLGVTKSHTPGARRYNMSLVQTNEYGQQEWQENFGGNREDIGNCITQVHDGSLFLGGGTSSMGNGEKDAWLIKTTANQEDLFELSHLAASNKGKVAISEFTFYGNKKNAAFEIKPNEKAYLYFEAKNNSREPLLNVSAEIKPLIQAAGLHFPDKLVIGNLLPGQSKGISIPVKSDDRLQKGISNLQVNLLTSNQLLQSAETNIYSSQLVPATLVIAEDSFTRQATRGSSYRAVLTVSIQNLGDQSAEDILGEFFPPPGIKPMADTKFKIDYLRPNSTHTASFDFMVDVSKSYNDGKVPVECTIKEKGGKPISGTYTLHLNKPEMNAGNARSPRSSKDLIWISPNPDEGGASRISDKEFVDIKVKAVSNNELKAQDFKIYLNNSAQDGSKHDTPALSKANRKGAAFTQTYENKVQLKLGVNIIEVEVLDAAGNVKTVPIEITYAPERPNLHVLAIGPTHEDLKYTGADAKDFADAFRNQENGLFNKVFIHALSEKDNTKKDNIKKALIDLQFNYQSNTKESISDKDLLIVFISSHAKQDGRNFVILPSDFEPRYESIYSLDFEKDIIQYLANINCKKLMFLDACNSGSAYTAVSGMKSTDKGLAEAINAINSTLPGMSTITSCQKQEKSYEDKAWKNGAFTESILEAFSNKSFADKSGRNYRSDMNNDNIITLGELSKYIKKRVPYLVSSAKPDAPTTQVPKVTNNELGDNFPIYHLNKK